MVVESGKHFNVCSIVVYLKGNEHKWQIVYCFYRVPMPPGKSLKVLDFFSLKFQDLESPGKSLWSWKVLEKYP